MTEKKILDAHRLSFIYEYIFCRCFPHKIIDVDFCFVLAIDAEVEHAVCHSLKLLILLGLLYHFSSRTKSLLASVCGLQIHRLCRSRPGSKSICLQLFHSIFSSLGFVCHSRFWPYMCSLFESISPLCRLKTALTRTSDMSAHLKCTVFGAQQSLDVMPLHLWTASVHTCIDKPALNFSELHSLSLCQGRHQFAKLSHRPQRLRFKLNLKIWAFR